MFKKILLSFLAVLILFQSTAAPVFAQQPSRWHNQSFVEWYSKVFDLQVSPAQEIFGERYTAAQVQWIVYGLWSFAMNFVLNLFGVDESFVACILPQVGNPAGLALGFGTCFMASKFKDTIETIVNLIKNNPFGAYAPSEPNLANLDKSSFKYKLSLVFQDRPDSGITYVKNIAKKATLVPEVKAQQGFGFGALNIVQQVWRKSRDVSYALLIFAAIILAFMVMFRTKISPQTVITAQSAIPKLFMAIILITFSYAIAGFLVDLVYVVIGIIASVLNGLPGGPGGTWSFDDIYKHMTIGFLGLGIFGELFIFFILFAFNFLFALPVFAGILSVIPPIIPFIMIIYLLGLLIVVCLIIWYFFKILFLLIRTLINVYLLVMVGPFYILAGVITPSLSFGSWVTQLLSNLMVFPVVGLMFVLGQYFLYLSGVAVLRYLLNIVTLQEFKDFINNVLNGIFNLGLPVSQYTGWTPPFLNFGVPLADLSPMLMLFVSLSILMLIPKIADIIKGFMSGRPFAFGTALGEAVGNVKTTAGWGAGGAEYRAAMAQRENQYAIQAAEMRAKGVAEDDIQKMLRRSEQVARRQDLIQRARRTTGI